MPYIPNITVKKIEIIYITTAPIVEAITLARVPLMQLLALRGVESFHIRYRISPTMGMKKLKTAYPILVSSYVLWGWL